MPVMGFKIANMKYVPEQLYTGEITPAQQKLIDVLNDTVSFYGEDPAGRRAVNEHDNCMYLVRDTGNKCAVGRLLPEEGLNIIADISETALGFTVEPVCIKYLPELSPSFLRQVQCLHDSKSYWDYNDKGLTDDGIRYYYDIFNSVVSGTYN